MRAIKMIRFRKYAIGLVSIASMLICCSACNNSVYYEEIRHIDNSKWNSKDTLLFHFTITDTLQHYDFGFSVRNTTTYDFQNLYMFITATYPGGNWSRDTAECILAAPDGKWYGKGMGKIKDSQFQFRRDVRFRKSGNYTIAVNQAMRQEVLDGISDIGIRITKTTAEK